MTRAQLCAYPTDWTEQQSLEPIVKTLRRRGVEMVIDRTMSRPSDVGLFIGHQEGNRAELARYPLIMLHDLGQAHNRWPDFWSKESWGDYEWGLVPNEMWATMAAGYPARERLPRQGIRNMGWPKSDGSYRRLQAHPRADAAHINGRLTVLYAPSWEYDGQQDKFLNAVADLPIDVVIKQQHFEGMGHNERVTEMARMHKGRWKNVYLLEPITKIFEVLQMADCIVSDESSTMVEGAMVGCVPIAVMDWKVPDTQPPRAPSVPFEFVNKLNMAELRGFLERLTDPAFLGQRRQALRQHSSHLPAHPGQAAEVFAQFLIECLAETPARAQTSWEPSHA
jgi:CDP-glycerol glycerophosphotransferase (TagB/SpsB family)